ncbi:hypothetical protein M3I54_22580 [Paraburkholderia sp. CNPSo 3274]|uniref:hypothetical protein n=1 Tax=Paraburkholderia sp. CNPSo 3274 TaxID=2940932 RepID=UPI0020B8143D|nr:hypothetical protein [Paraburkholderia sp. CNPSo 3274]MCP3709733.1 hypothetical protein [Paraburkholderia sp. CNPSo 3274]
MTTTNPGPAITANPVPCLPIGNLQKMAIITTVSITPVAVAANTTAQQNFAASGLGLQQGDVCEVIAGPSFQAGLITQPTIAGAPADQLTITFGNVTASPITPAAGIYTVRVTRLQAFDTVASGAGYMNSF